MFYLSPKNRTPCWALLSRPAVYYANIDDIHSYWASFLIAGYSRQMRNGPNDSLLQISCLVDFCVKREELPATLFQHKHFKNKHKLAGKKNEHRLRDRLASWCHNFYPSEERG
jgi:hypothetical protein